MSETARGEIPPKQQLANAREVVRIDAMQIRALQTDLADLRSQAEALAAALEAMLPPASFDAIIQTYGNPLLQDITGSHAQARAALVAYRGRLAP